METNVLTTLQQFLKHGGEPSTAATLLSSSYRGYAQLCNLVGEWILEAGGERQLVVELVENFIEQIVMATFDPKTADTVFAEAFHTPRWLEFMIEKRRWRQLLYKLSEQYKDCLLLNFAIQRISDAGHHKELAAYQSASTYMSVFQPVLLDSLATLIQSTNAPLHSTDALTTERYQTAFTSLSKLCSYKENTYLFTQCILFFLISFAKQQLSSSSSSSPSSSSKQQNSSIEVLTRLSEDLRAHVVHSQGSEAKSLVYRIALLLNPEFDEYPELRSYIHSALVDPSISVENSDKFIARLHDVFFPSALSSSQPQTPTTPTTPGAPHHHYASSTVSSSASQQQQQTSPPCELLHMREIFDLLIHAAFDPAKPCAPDTLQKVFQLLAFASTPSQSPSALGEATTIQHTFQPQSSGDNGGRRDLTAGGRTTLFDLVLSRLWKVHKVIRTVVGSKFQSENEQLRQMIRDFPLIAACVLYWIGECLKDESYFMASYHSNNLQIFLSFLIDIASFHESHLDKVSAILSQAFQIRTELDALTSMELKKKILECMIELMKMGYVLPILQQIYTFSQTIDQSLIRYFVFQLLAIAAPPYSEQFATAVINIIASPRTFDALKVALSQSASSASSSSNTATSESQAKQIDQFLRSCLGLEFSDPTLSTTLTHLSHHFILG